jgi:hypothetical protein
MPSLRTTALLVLLAHFVDEKIEVWHPKIISKLEEVERIVISRLRFGDSEAKELEPIMWGCLAGLSPSNPLMG